MVRVLVGPDTDDLDELYAVRRDARPWLRVNMVSTVDGAATGDSGKSGSINNAVDKRVFDHLRRLADVIVVGAGTARDGGLPADGPADRRGQPARRGARAAARRAARRGADGDLRQRRHLDEARAILGAEHVLVLGAHRVDLAGSSAPWPAAG